MAKVLNLLRVTEIEIVLTPECLPQITFHSLFTIFTMAISIMWRNIALRQEDSSNLARFLWHSKSVTKNFTYGLYLKYFLLFKTMATVPTFLQSFIPNKRIGLVKTLQNLCDLILKREHIRLGNWPVTYIFKLFEGRARLSHDRISKLRFITILLRRELTFMEKAVVCSGLYVQRQLSTIKLFLAKPSLS